jgi:squalene synthase HpnC
MTAAGFATELARHGPAGELGGVAPSLEESFAYCRHLAETHYENFVVASRLLPRPLRQHFANVYAYCRWSDDLADETSGREESLSLLDWWEGQLEECYAGRAVHPVFVALAHTVREFEIPLQPLRDLLSAFRQDQLVARYETFADLLDYCRHSANPVGRLVLYLGRSHDNERGRLADSICTGLQLANFWQDVAEDWRRGRVYIPAEDCRRFGFAEADFATGRSTAAFERLMAFEVARAEEYLRSGLPLVDRLPGWLAGDIWLIAHGGLKILAKIRSVRYDVWCRRPTVSRWDQTKLLVGYLVRRLMAGRR